MTELNVLVSTSKEVPLGGFVVARIKREAKILGPDDIVEVYHATGSMADDLFGWGIARRLADKYGKSLLIFNPDEVVTFPGEEDCD